MNEKPLLTKEYSISIEMFGKAFKDFQKKFAYPRNIAMSLAFAVIIGCYIPPLIRNPDNTTCVMIIVVCVFLIAGMWFKLFSVRRNLMHSIDGIQGDIYIAEFYESKMNISTSSLAETEETETQTVLEAEEEEDEFFAESDTNNDNIVKTVIDFELDDVCVLEKEDYFIIYLVKRMFYIIPKKNFDDNERDLMRTCFKHTKFISSK